MRKIAVKTVWMRKTAWAFCTAAAAALCVWCISDNLLPVFRANGSTWALRAAGLSLVPDTPAETTGPETTPLPESTPQGEDMPEDGVLSPWTEPKAAPTPDPARETAPVAETQLLGGKAVDGFSVKDTSESGVDLLEELQIDPDVHVKRDGSPVVLLYSTHTSESFLQFDTDW